MPPASAPALTDAGRATLLALQQRYKCPIWQGLDGTFTPLATMGARHMQNCYRITLARLDAARHAVQPAMTVGQLLAELDHPLWGLRGDGALDTIRDDWLEDDYLFVERLSPEAQAVRRLEHLKAEFERIARERNITLTR